MLFRSKYQVDVYYIDERGWRRYLNSIIVIARTKDRAVKMAYDAVWDTRLECAGCSPDFIVHKV